MSKDPNIHTIEIDFFTNGIIHLFVDYFKGKISISLDEIGGLSNKLFYKLAREQPEV